MTGNRDKNLSEHAPEVRIEDETMNDELPDGRPVDDQTDKSHSEAWLDWNVIDKIVSRLVELGPDDTLEAGFLYGAVGNTKFWKSANGRPFTLTEVGRLVIDKIKGEGLSDDFVKPLCRLVESLEAAAQDALVTVVEQASSKATLTNTCVSRTATITNTFAGGTHE